MSPFILITGLGLFLFAWFSHLVVWRLFAIRRETLWLLLLFFGVPFILLSALWQNDSLSGIQAFAVALLSLSLCSAYVQTYPVLRHVIPTFRILLLLDDSPGQGLLRTDILRILADEGLFSSGLKDLENDALVSRNAAGEYAATASGAALADTFAAYRRLLGLDGGAG